MMQIINDKYGRMMGTISDSGDYVYIRDKSGNSLGYYSQRWDKTYYMNGTVFGDGNLLMSFLYG